MLLSQAVATLGAAAVAQALGVTPEAIDRLAGETEPMSPSQQWLLALAVLAMSEGHAALRRRAAALLSQVAAAIDFTSGVTATHGGPPPSNRW